LNDEENKLGFLNIVIVIFVLSMLIVFVQKGVNVLQNITQICVVEQGALKFEESTRGYIIREETVLQGENYKNGMVQIVSEGQRIAKDSTAFRYYSNGEDEILEKIATLDDEIDNELENSKLNIWSTDITNLENQIEKVVDSMYNINDLDEIQDKISELDTYISKKTKITGNLSPADSHVKSLIEQRNTLENSLTEGAEKITSPVSGIISYRIDGLEEILGTSDFSYLNTEFLDNLDTKTDSIIATSTEKGKVVNNFECYIACPMNTEKSSSVKVGDKVMLRLPDSKEVEAEISYISQEDKDSRVIVFKIKENVENLTQYREIYVDVIWWSYSGLKISNSAILEENDLNYIERSKAGYSDKIYVKVLRQNDTYSIIENYTNEELLELGIDSKFVEKATKLSVYDEILVH